MCGSHRAGRAGQGACRRRPRTAHRDLGHSPGAVDHRRNMPTELIMLALSIALGLTHVLLHGHAASLQRGYGWALSPRDAAVEPLMGIPARLDRAMRNYLETFTF